MLVYVKSYCKESAENKGMYVGGNSVGRNCLGSLGNCLFPLQIQGLIGKMSPKNADSIRGLEEVKQMAASRR